MGPAMLKRTVAAACAAGVIIAAPAVGQVQVDERLPSYEPTGACRA